MTLMGLWCLGKWCTIQRKRWLFYELTGQTSSKKRSTTSTIFKIFGATVVCNIDSMKYIFCHSKTNWHLIHAQKDIFLFRRIRFLTESYEELRSKMLSHIYFFRWPNLGRHFQFGLGRLILKIVQNHYSLTV